MKVTRLEVKTLLGLKEFKWDGKNIELTGKKGVGKTSVVDAIKLVLSARSGRPCIIREGSKEGEVLIETDAGHRVCRKYRTDKADYKSIKQGTDKEEKTESFLREIFTELQLDPVRFSLMDEKEQNRLILDMIDFKWDMQWIKEQFGEIPPEVNYEQNILNVLYDIQAEEGYYFQERQTVNREIRNKQACIEEIGVNLPANYDAKTWESANVGDLYKKIETIRNNNEWIEKAKTSVNNRENKIRGFQATKEIDANAVNRETVSTRHSLEKQIVELENKIKEYRKELDTLEEKKLSKLEIIEKTYQASVAELDGEVKQYEGKAKETPGDFSDLQKKAEHTEQMKAFVNEYKRMVGLQEDIVKLNEKTEDYTVKIEKARTLPGEILQKANIPVVGLTIENGIPLINGRSIKNLSDGEKLELCISVAVQSEASLKLMLIDGMEKLPTADRKKVYKKLKDNGVQFVATRTTDEDTLNVVELE